MSSTSSEHHSGSASSRNHNQGRQDRNYTSAQVAAVQRVRRCKITDYYAILDIECPSSDSEIRKAYRKLALIMHPDKNGAPGADEAFKLVSKAFQVLSDADKKRIFDQTGSDPDLRGTPGFASSRGGGAGMGPEMNFGGAEVSAEDLFNMFFGGSGLGGSGLGGGFSNGSSFGGFGGPGIRVHTFGGGSPFSTFTTGTGGPSGAQARARAARASGNHNNTQDDAFSLHNLIQLLPLLLLFGMPLLLNLLGDSSDSGYSTTRPGVHFKESPPFIMKRSTPQYHVTYYVNPSEVSSLSDSRLRRLDRQAENSFIKITQNNCYQEYEQKQQKIADSRGWFSVDQEAYDQAMSMTTPSCDILDNLHIPYSF